MAISAKQVKELRDMTGAGMMDCKKALVETDGDVEAAAEYLQVKGLAKAAKKASRVAAEGLIGAAISDDRKTGVLLEVNCETDFVARNDAFQGLVDKLTQHALANNISTAEELLASEIDGKSVETLRQENVSTIGENISIRRVERISIDGEGVVGDYVHNGNIGVLVQISADSDVSSDDTIYALARDVAMHTAAMNPQFATQNEIDDEVIATQERIEIEKAMESGKPEEIAKKMVIGRLKKWKKEISLADQPFVKNGDVTIEEEVKRVAGETGNSLSLVSFSRLVRGEGIEKEETNLADEVAQFLK